MACTLPALLLLVLAVYVHLFQLELSRGVYICVLSFAKWLKVPLLCFTQSMIVLLSSCHSSVEGAFPLGRSRSEVAGGLLPLALASSGLSFVEKFFSLLLHLLVLLLWS